MNLDHHEEIFRKKLQGHYPPVDTQKLWKQIESEIVSDKRKRRPLLLWWIFGGLSVLVVLTLVIFLLNENELADQPRLANLEEKLNNKTRQQSELASIQLSENTSNINATTDEKVNENTLSSDNSNDISTTDQINTKIHNNINTNGEGEADTPEPLNDKRTQNHQFRSSKNTARTNASESAIKSQNKLSEIESNLNPINENKVIIESNNGQLISSTDKVKSTSDSEQSIDQQSQTAAIESEFNSSSLLQLSSKETTRLSDQRLTSINTLASLGGKVISRQETALAYAPIQARKRKAHAWYAMLEAGYGEYVVPNPAPELDPFTIPALENLYLETDYQHVSLKLGYKIGRSFAIQTGIGFTKLRQRTFISDAVEVSSFSGSDIDIFYANDSSELATIAAGDVNYIDKPISKTLDRNLFEVPLLVGYERTFNRMYVGAHGGILCYFATSTKGDYIDDRNRLVSVQENSIVNTVASFGDYETTSSFGIGYVANLSVGYYITPDIDVYISPQVKYTSGILTSTQSQTELGVLSGGAQVGLRMRL